MARKAEIGPVVKGMPISIPPAAGPKRRVISVSIAGRGKSDWLPNKDDYGYPQYMNDMTALMARVTAAGATEINWVGTSMGGMLGMLLASRPNTPLQRLVLNDVGTLIPKASMERIGAPGADLAIEGETLIRAAPPHDENQPASPARCCGVRRPGAARAPQKLESARAARFTTIGKTLSRRRV